MNYEIDLLDRKILKILVEDGRRPFLEIARELKVSGGTVHQRVEKMQQAGVLKGFTTILNRDKLGYQVQVLAGVHLGNARDCSAVVDAIKEFPEVLEVHYTSGNYALMVKIAVSSITEYYDFLSSKLQALPQIRSTESFICMASPISKEVSL